MNATGSPAESGSDAAISASSSFSRPWLKSYPPNVPHTIDETTIGTLVDFFRHGVTAYEGRPAVESFGKRMTFGAGERILSDWMSEMRSSPWLEHPAPWDIERQLIAELRPPLNRAENSHHSFYSELSQLRRQAKAPLDRWK